MKIEIADKRYFVEIDGGRKFRSVTEEDIAQVTAERLLGMECSHLIFYDESAFMFTYRHCAVCNKLIGLI